jgi:transposase-like protein
MNNTSKRYPVEVRERAVHMVLEHQDEYDSDLLDRDEARDYPRDNPEMGAPRRDR